MAILGALNGWQRLWLVVSGLWLTPWVIALVAGGVPTVYSPPAMKPWTMTCDLKVVVERLIVNGESEADIAPVIKAADNGKVSIEFFKPEGDDDPDTPLLTCSDASLVYNPDTKGKRLAVHATLDGFTYGTFLAGYDLGDAIGKQSLERVRQTKEKRRRAVMAGTAFALVPPLLLYSLGVCFVWIRRGFRQQDSAILP